MKRIHLLSGLLFLLVNAVGLPGSLSSAWAQDFRVAVLHSIRHPALDEAASGVIQHFQDKDVKIEFTQVFMNREQDEGKNEKDHITKISELDPDLVITLGTQASQEAVRKMESVDIVFSAVTDPVGAGLITDMHKPGGRVTGLTDMSPVREQLDMITWVHPGISALGIVFSEFEQNAVMIKKKLQEMAGDSGLELLTAPVGPGGDVQDAALGILDRVQALYISTDNYVVQHVSILARLCALHDVPLYAADPSSVAEGAMASLSIDYHSMGLQTGTMAKRILEGEKPGDISVEKPREVNITINTSSAERMNVDLPLDLMLAADRVYDRFPETVP
ncbi:ABC transporter substrate-binding protein [Desulfonatronospira sp.]|uniref:ABC transporter substrate-binding protein n=1 Tax=Desulfonatronospira sp. TaxID=1962951 RepID=UPI0025BA2612|nr:ABC transporter substrate-binding protein [Desulfonatronospira sp.]